MKKIIIIGSGYSGSGAVVDYLAGRSDIMDPFQGKEFRLIHDPDGLMELFLSCNRNFTVQGTSSAINDFIDFCKRYHTQGVIKNIKLAESFINRITTVEYKAAPYCERIKMNFIRRRLFLYQEKWLLSRGKKVELVTMRIPVDEEEFILRSQEFLDDLIEDSLGRACNGASCVINHGGSFWKPVSSTVFFGDRKTIIVLRDVRDVYAEMSLIGRAYPGRDAQLFCSWYQSVMKKIDASEWEDKTVMKITFEDFVLDYESSVKRICSHIDADPSSASSYNPAKSAVNIGKYKNILSREEISCIENNLKEYCYL
mgnify:CR=1 FL=1